MLGKLIKLDLRTYRAQLKWVLPIYGLLLLSSLIVKGLGIPYLGEIAHAFSIIGTVLVIPAALILGLIHYYRHFYTNQGYLTHTLPVTASQRYHSKFVSGFILYLLATVITFFGVNIAVLAKSLGSGQGFSALGDMYTTMFAWHDKVGFNPIWIWLLLLVFWFFIYLYFFAIYSFSISVGMGRRLARFGVGGPILVYIVLYIFYQITALLAFLFLPLSLRLQIDMTAITENITTYSDVVKLSLVNSMPIKRFVELGMMGSKFGDDVPPEIVFGNGGYIDIGLGIFLVMLAVIIFSYFFTKYRLSRVDLR
ncbi:MAG TPA: hypothetical protein GXX72_09390 [Clostridiaceae bacterium]|nr:hypothetical protein [Clostridiaceae bacterium]